MNSKNYRSNSKKFLRITFKIKLRTILRTLVNEAPCFLITSKYYTGIYVTVFSIMSLNLVCSYRGMERCYTSPNSMV